MELYDSVDSDCAPLDPRILADLRQLDSENGGGVLSELVDVFLEELKGRLAVLRDSLGKGDLRSASSAAHAIKGSSRSLGANRMAAICEAIERVPEAAGCDELTLLESEAARVKRALEGEKLTLSARTAGSATSPS
jgi:HPt (histidine-containing phosphotransfer) domain-containing protein